MEYNDPDCALEAILRQTSALLERDGRAFLAIDGRCASGKTTLAGQLAQRLPCTLVHMDDFFLQPQQRTPQRLAQPGGNVDRERFLSEVLSPLLAGRDAVYRPFDCHTFQMRQPVTAPCRPVVLVEGSYSCHPDLWDRYGLHIFVTASLDTRLERLARRPGANLANFRTRWIPLEERYFEAFPIQQRCEVVVHT